MPLTRFENWDRPYITIGRCCNLSLLFSMFRTTRLFLFLHSAGTRHSRALFPRPAPRRGSRRFPKRHRECYVCSGNVTSSCPRGGILRCVAPAPLHFPASLARLRVATHTGAEMPRCMGEDLTGESGRRYECPTANGLDYCVNHGLHDEPGASPASGEGSPRAGGDERQREGRGREREVVWALPSRNQASQGEGLDGLRTNRSGPQLTREAKSKDIGASEVGQRRLASLLDEETEVTARKEKSTLAQGQAQR